MQRDPIDAASGDPNLYRYCGNEPVNYVDVAATQKREKQPVKSASKAATAKARKRVAVIAVGDISYGWLSPVVSFAVSSKVQRMELVYRRLGYQVLVDEQCTYDDFMKYLASEDVRALVFIGHSDELGLVPSPAFEGDLRSIAPDDVKRTLRSRRIERVELNSCHTDTKEWRSAFNEPEQFVGMRGLYNPVLSIDYGRSFLGNLLKRHGSKKAIR